MATFSAWDYVVFIGMLIVSAGIGVYHRFSGGKQKTTQEYLMANGNMPVLPVAFSLMASFISAVTLMGVSNENYQFGIQFIVVNISYGLFTPIAAYLFLPVFYKMQVRSAYEYLEKRFGQLTRLTASSCYTLQMILYMGISLYAPALALEAVTGLNRWWAVIIIGVVCTFYSTIGGMKAVIWADVFQSLLMFAAVYTVIIWCLVQAGGFGPIIQAAIDGDRIQIFNFELDPTVRHTWWSLILGGGFTFISLYAVNQTQVQRLMTVNSLKKAQATLWVNWPILSAISLSTSFSGLCLYWYYQTCDPFLKGAISSRDQIMPLFIMDALADDYKGLPGLFVAGIFSACLSSVSSSVNSIATVVVEDYIKLWYLKLAKNPLPDSKLAIISKITTLFAGALCIGVAFMAENLGGVLEASLTVFAAVGGPLFALFSLGMTTQRANQRAGVVAILLGIGLGLWMGFGGPKPPPPSLDFNTDDCSAFDWGSSRNTFANSSIHPVKDDEDYFYLYRISYQWVAPVTYLFTYITGYVLSWILELLKFQGETKIYLDAEHTQVNFDLFVPPVAKLFQKIETRKKELKSNSE